MTIAHIVNTSFDWNAKKPTGEMMETLLDIMESQGAKVYAQNRSDYWVVEANLNLSDFHRIAKRSGVPLSMHELEGRIQRASL